MFLKSNTKKWELCLSSIVLKRVTLGEMKTDTKNKQAFTLIELLVVIAIIAILAAILMPVLDAAKQRAQMLYCLNNQRQWGLAFRMYTDDNSDYVPEEGDTAQPINYAGTPGSTPNLTMAWYNVIPPEVGSVALVDLYGGNGYTPQQPVPTSHSLFSCPSSPLPLYTLGYGNSANPTPTFSKAFFMYGENCRLCVNWSTRYTSSGQPTGVQQTKMINIMKPSQTVFLAEVDPDAANGSSSVGNPESSVGPSESCVSAFYATARHMKNTLGNLIMCDGSATSLHTNMFWESQGEADGTSSGGTGAEEWSDGPQIYWYPSPTTPN